MGMNANTRCPRCGVKADVQLDNEDGFCDVIAVSNSEEIVVEIGCKQEDCNKVWRAVYAFAGNQE